MIDVPSDTLQPNKNEAVGWRTPMRGTCEPMQNLLLIGLPANDLQRIRSCLTSVTLRVGDALYEAGSQIHYVYFPTTAIVSLLYMTSNGSSSNVAVVGNEGLIGVSSFMGDDTAPSRAVVQSAGHAYRLSGTIIKQEFMRGGAVQRALLRYTHALLAQTAQTAVCNRHHSLEQRLCRWLLSLDRSASNHIVMTQELIANMLGVRREGVTEAAGKLQNAGMIEYRRGHITILNRAALEGRTCECYAIVKLKCDDLAPKPLVVQTMAVSKSAAAPKPRPFYSDRPLYPDVSLAASMPGVAP
jgi:CRP-like cAMP-binding protein